LLKEFEFADGGRTFICTVEAPAHAGMPPWWWFKLDGEKTTRYAPFAASESDTKQSVQKRIIAYYVELLAIRARPVHQRPTWHKPVRPPETETAATGTPASAATTG